MAKKNDEEIIYSQGDLFGFSSKIVGLGIVDVKIAKGDITAVLKGMSEAQDLAGINDESWLSAIAEWMVNLTNNDGEKIGNLIDAARSAYYKREQDLLAAKEALKKASESNIASFPSSAVGAIAG